MFPIEEVSREEAIAQARDLFIPYFTELYKEVPSDVLGIENVSGYLQAVFNKTGVALKEKAIRGFLAYSDQRPVGFSTCGLLEDREVLLLRTMAIHLDYKDREVAIRNALLEHIRCEFPSAKRVVVMVRKANVHQASLCLQVGFKKESDLFQKSSYLKTTYSPEWYEAFGKSLFLNIS